MEITYLLDLGPILSFIIGHGHVESRHTRLAMYKM
jgi:hypothetical protein